MVFKNKTDVYSVIKVGTHFVIEVDTGRVKYDFFMPFRSREEAQSYLKYHIGPYPSLSLDEWKYHSYLEE